MIFDQGPLHTIHQGHVLSVLPAIPEHSVNLVVTSPPYYGLRAYGCDPLVWESPCQADHAHEWRDVFVYNNNTGGGLTPKQKTNRGSYSSDSFMGGELPRKAEGPRGYSCAECDCGAFLGSLGQEPIMDCGAWARFQEPCHRCYVCHLRTIFAAVARVLHPSGSLWLNLGDSYAAQGGAQIDGTKQTRGSQQGAWNGVSRKPAGDLPPKNLYGVPWRVALALQSDGWILRNDVVWIKPSSMPQSCKDRLAASHEYWFLLTRSPRYHFDEAAVRMPFSDVSIQQLRSPYTGKATKKYEGSGAQDPSDTKRRAIESMKRRCGRNHRTSDLWRESLRSMAEMATAQGLILDEGGEPVAVDCSNGSYKGEHFATFSGNLIAPFIRAGTSPAGRCSACRRPYERQVDIVDDEVRQSFTPPCQCDALAEPCVALDPFLGSGTTMEVALLHGARAIGIELNPDYCEQARLRAQAALSQGPPEAQGSAREDYRRMRDDPPAFRLPAFPGERMATVLDARDSLLEMVSGGR